MNGMRVSGILAHLTSLPGGAGIGDLGAGAYAFVDFLAKAGQKRWQILPLGPTGFGDSPYSAVSAFAGNPLLISLDALVESGLLEPGALAALPPFHPDRVDYGHVIESKAALLGQAFDRFDRAPPAALADAFGAFCKDAAEWLDGYALFSALKEHFHGAPWYQWEMGLRRRDRVALDGWAGCLARQVARYRFEQFLFFHQWRALKSYAAERGVTIVGDLPIFVPYDSADVWMHPELFILDDTGVPSVVAGVPPDYFSETGQLWGNPLYNWPVHAATGYRWWLERIRTTLALCDLVRIDHFRGFEAYWEVPADHPTAEFGKWVKGPGMAFFDVVQKALGASPLPLIAENLGVITPQVEALRHALGLPGMAVLQFAFDSDGHNIHLPHWHERNMVVYTGTHDNDTTLGWFMGLEPDRQQRVRHYLGAVSGDIHWAMIRQALASVADTAILPLQDVLGLDASARMNRPGCGTGNWRWRVAASALDDRLAGRLAEETQLFAR